MPSRKMLKIVATVLLVAGNIFMLGFLGILLCITLALTVFAVPFRAILSSPIAGATIAAVVTPQYLAVMCYKVAAVLGLMQVHLPKDKHHWIGFVKTSVDFVFLLSAGASIWITALFAIDISNPSLNDNILVVLSWLQIAVISIAIGFHLASMLVWKCSIVPSADEQTTDQLTNKEARDLELKLMN